MDEGENTIKRLKLAIALTFSIFIVEIIGGYLTNSLALLADTAHVFMDTVALSMSLLAIFLSKMPSSKTKTYGWHRLEVFASFLNGCLLSLISILIFYSAYNRFFTVPSVKGGGVIIISTIGFFVNLLVAYWLSKSAKKDLNIKSAFYHVVGDALASIGAIASGIIIYFTSNYIFDPIISVVISIIILIGSTNIIRESSQILLEGVPRGIDLKKVIKEIATIKGVKGLHSVHIWSICSNSYAFSAHVDIYPTAKVSSGDITDTINALLAERYNILYTTLQIDCNTCDEDTLLRAIGH